jgi:hypothetical protein
VRRRICVVGAALSAASLGFGAVSATAAKSPAGTNVTKVTCKTNVGIMVAGSDTGVTPPVQKGAEYGIAVCGKLLGSGVQADKFSVPDTGNTLAQYQMYLPTGTIHGKYKLIPQEGSFNGSNFNEVDTLGTLTITGGTGTYQGAKGTGTMKCKSLDGIHTTCTDKLKLTKL